MTKKMIMVWIGIAAAVIVLAAGCSMVERKLLFFPSHGTNDNGFAHWLKNGELIGYARIVQSPKSVWLMLHGNGGQASDRNYAMHCFSAEDSVFVLEYPGYGNRNGTPSKASFNAAAKTGYQLLRETYPTTPVCVVSESIGSGPAASLAELNPPPDKLVLIVPFDKLSLVAKEHVPAFLVSLFLRSNWDNAAALAKFKGPVEIFGAKEDSIIPVDHAKKLAAAVPSSKFILIEGGHNEWSQGDRVRIRNP